MNDFLSFSSFNNKLKQEFELSSTDTENFNMIYQSNVEFRNILNSYLKNVAQFLAQVSIYFDLDEVIFGGGISYLSPIFLKKIEEYFYQELSNNPFKTKIKPTQLKNSARLVGVLKLLQANKL
ncbi:ROK family protein [Mesomycoplasma hyorhinis]|uniref:Glucokinase n=1 Tax=Mesomycoplasma hyorhinis (strain MCLD) TaxID=936139 RepID=A0ABM5M5T7_MESHM|nr:glucokinase [Mesomycoplasma hyorhinis MCLD]